MTIVQNLLIVSLLVIGSGCEFTYKIKNGQEAFEVKQYAVASEMFAEEYSVSNTAQERAQKAFMLGRSYEQMNNPKEAASWFQLAAEEGYGDEASARYADNLARLQYYEEAIAVYSQLMASTGDATLYRPRITACKQASQWLSDTDRSEYKISPVAFNSPASDYAPYVMGPDVVLFTSDRENGGGEAYKWTGRSFSDIYIAQTDVNSVAPFDPPINSKHNDGTITFTSDRLQIFFSRCFQSDQLDAYCKIMTSIKDGSSWTDPVELPFIEDGINYAHPALSANDSLMIFSSNDPAGKGGYDLFYSQLTADGWGKPVNLSSRLNTVGDEMYPSLHDDTLYFSSDKHVGMGGLDVFKSYVNRQGNWVPAYNLKAPINSGWDDFGFVVDTFAQLRGNVIQQGYFSSSRQNGDGSDDIFAFTRSKPEPVAADIIVASNIGDDEEKKIVYELYLAIRVMEPIFADHNDPNSERVGKRPLVRARVNIEEGVMARTFRTDEDGYLIMTIDWDKQYLIEAKFSGFLAKKVDFNANVLEKDPERPVKTHNLEIVLDPIFKGKEILLDDIFYDLDKWNIRQDAEPSLNGLVSILKDNPRIRIELGSHTDCRADDAYNLELSQKRAQSAVDYLISKGIKGERLQAVGYGETQFAVNCACEECTEEEHQANRRTTFKIVE
jgi:outer membrane protein OmpA-like peptidoglycan-associated protein/tetratricopeptide (TPR) repeat protein